MVEQEITLIRAEAVVVVVVPPQSDQMAAALAAAMAVAVQLHPLVAPP
jgi:ABC-type branched-subunit amino acid transport system substrate-binding protein